MCCFSGNVAEVANTNIFARISKFGRQILVYSMKYIADDELAMILPIPTPVYSSSDAVRFIDLSNYLEFFDHIRSGFPHLQLIKNRNNNLTGGIAVDDYIDTLKVYDVGSYEASFVPNKDDFNYLDKRFRLPDMIWSDLPKYHDYGFVVCKLKPGAKSIHPIAFEFPSREPEKLFFPTLHIHNGRVESKVKFDHILYCQTNGQQCDWPFSSNKYIVDSIIDLLFTLTTDKEKEILVNARVNGLMAKTISIYQILSDRSKNSSHIEITREKIRQQEQKNATPAKEFINIDLAQGIIAPDKYCQMEFIYGLENNEDIFLSSHDNLWKSRLQKNNDWLKDILPGLT
jgi:hypothetical protein